MSNHTDAYPRLLDALNEVRRQWRAQKILEGVLLTLTGVIAVLVLLVASPAVAGVGDPQVRTDHPWYPGELACSTFDRLFATQAEVYKRVTGRACTPSSS